MSNLSSLPKFGSGSGGGAALPLGGPGVLSRNPLGDSWSLTLDCGNEWGLVNENFAMFIFTTSESYTPSSSITFTFS